jgi:hypothetical protein
VLGNLPVCPDFILGSFVLIPLINDSEFLGFVATQVRTNGVANGAAETAVFVLNTNNFFPQAAVSSYTEHYQWGGNYAVPHHSNIVLGSFFVFVTQMGCEMNRRIQRVNYKMDEMKITALLALHLQITAAE